MKRQGFLRVRRILKKGAFLKVQKNGHRIVTKHLVFLILPNDLGLTRLGLIVSKKVGNAPTRNRVKRVIREAFRILDPLADESLDIVVIPRPSLKHPAKLDVIMAAWDKMRLKYSQNKNNQ